MTVPHTRRLSEHAVSLPVLLFRSPAEPMIPHEVARLGLRNLPPNELDIPEGQRGLNNEIHHWQECDPTLDCLTQRFQDLESDDLVRWLRGQLAFG